MITTVDLKTQTRRELAEIARNYGVSGWHGMKKDELLTEIKKVQRRLRRKAATESKKVAASGSSATQPIAKAKTSPAVAKKATKAASSTRKRGSVRKPEPTEDLTKPKITAKQARIRAEMRRRRELVQRHKDLSTDTLVGGSAVTDGSNRHRADVPHRDRVALVVRDAYWLQASWEITRASVQRAQAALAEKCTRPFRRCVCCRLATLRTIGLKPCRVTSPSMVASAAGMWTYRILRLAIAWRSVTWPVMASFSASREATASKPRHQVTVSVWTSIGRTSRRITNAFMP